MMSGEFLTEHFCGFPLIKEGKDGERDEMEEEEEEEKLRVEHLEFQNLGRKSSNDED